MNGIKIARCIEIIEFRFIKKFSNFETYAKRNNFLKFNIASIKDNLMKILLIQKKYLLGTENLYNEISGLT